MIKKIYKIIKRIGKIRSLSFKYLYSGSRLISQGKCNIHSSVKIINSRVKISEGGEVDIEEGVVLENVNIYVNKGCKLFVGKGNIINNGNLHRKLKIHIQDGCVKIGSRNRIQCDMWVRFGGNVLIGNATNINYNSEIRCDESVIIGDYNQISYNCSIWDTNTHNIYSDDERRKLTDEYYPVFGYEYEKPKTKPVIIENDCWIGKNVAILKGTKISNSSIVGFGTILSNFQGEENITILNKTNIQAYARSTSRKI